MSLSAPAGGLRAAARALWRRTESLTSLSRPARGLSVAAAALCVLSVGLATIPAFASPAPHGAAFDGPPQQLTTATYAPAAAASTERDDFTVHKLYLVQWPVADTHISSFYGPRAAPCDGCSSFHRGIDFDAGEGAPVEAIADGTVVGIDSVDGSYGQHVVVRHELRGEVVYSLYAHMEVGSITVHEGEKITRGTVVGKLGSTGAVSGANLHLSIMNADMVEINPLPWMQAHVNASYLRQH